LAGTSAILLTGLVNDMNDPHDTGLRLALHGASATIGEFESYCQKVGEAVRRVMSMTNADYWADHYKNIHVFPKSSGFEAAPFTVTDNDENFRSMTVDRNMALRANRVFVKNSRPMQSMWNDTYDGDEFGTGITFPTTYALNVKPIIRVNSVDQVVIAIGDWHVPNWDWYYIPTGIGVFQNAVGPPLGTGDVIEIIYPGPLQYVYEAEDETAIATDGLWEAIVEGKDLPGYEEMEELGDAELLRRKTNPVDATINTHRTGLWPGQLLTINTTQPLLNDTLVVRSVSGWVVDGKYFDWTVKASNSQLQNPETMRRYMADMVQRDRQPVPRGRFSIHIELAGDIPGDTNPGLEVRTVPGARTAERSGWIREWRMGWEDGAPFSADLEIDIKQNGVSIFGATKAVYEAGSTGAVFGFTFSSENLEVAVGDKFTAESLSADSTAKNGWVDLIIDG
jgi:hypothetical protein